MLIDLREGSTTACRPLCFLHLSLGAVGWVLPQFGERLRKRGAELVFEVLVGGNDAGQRFLLVGQPFKAKLCEFLQDGRERWSFDDRRFRRSGSGSLGDFRFDFFGHESLPCFAWKELESLREVWYDLARQEVVAEGVAKRFQRMPDEIQRCPPPLLGRRKALTAPRTLSRTAPQSRRAGEAQPLGALPLGNRWCADLRHEETGAAGLHDDVRR
jgi:hypothetical protein